MQLTFLARRSVQPGPCVLFFFPCISFLIFHLNDLFCFCLFCCCCCCSVGLLCWSLTPIILSATVLQTVFFSPSYHLAFMCAVIADFSCCLSASCFPTWLFAYRYQSPVFLSYLFLLACQCYGYCLK